MDEGEAEKERSLGAGRVAPCFGKGFLLILKKRWVQGLVAAKLQFEV